MGLGNNSRSPGRDIKVGFLRARERDGGFGSAGAGEWQSQRCWTSRRGERRLGMYLAASRIHTVKCIFPASLLPSSALFPWLPGLGREPSLFQAGETPSTMLAAHGTWQRASLQGKGKQSLPPATPACNSTRTLPNLPGLSQPLTPGRHSTQGKSQGLLQMALKHRPLPAGLNFPCVCKRKKIIY